MRPHYLPPAPPISGVVATGQPSVGPQPAKILGGLPTLRLRTGVSLLTGVHFDAVPYGICSTHAVMP